MTPAVEQLVREAMQLTGSDAPELLEEDAPVLAGDAISEDGFYLVGLIGGKDVGKSALVNALAGRKITETTSHGPGTEIAVAYAHVAQESALRELLEKEVPGHYRIVTHEIPSLKRQVLLDLPDIDSRWESHPLVTRAMLRHMLFPLWIVLGLVIPAGLWLAAGTILGTAPGPVFRDQNVGRMLAVVVSDGADENANLSHGVAARIGELHSGPLPDATV